MKKFFATIGILFLLLIVGGGGWLWFTIQEGIELDETSRTFVSQKIPELAKKRWYGPVFRPIAHTLLMESVSQEQWQALSERYYNTLGDFVRMEECQGQARIDFNDNGKQVSAEYQCPAQFKNGAARIDISLLQEEDRWKVIKLYINSDLFLR